MPGSVIGTRMNNGYAGTVSRTADSIIQNRIAKIEEGDPEIAFGQAVVLNSDNTFSLVGESTTATQIAGIAVREVIQANTFNPQSNPNYQNEMPMDVLVRGQCTVKCQRGTPAAGAAVYVRIKANATYQDAVVGGFEAADDTGNVIQVPNIEWTTGILDTNNIAEVTVKTRQKG